jgi:stage IV sporulation protein FB
VVDGGGRLRGFLTREAMIVALKNQGPSTPVLSVMTEVPKVRSGERLAHVVRQMQSGSGQLVAVVDEGDRLLGYVSQENLGEMIMLEQVRPPGMAAPRRSAA